MRLYHKFHKTCDYLRGCITSYARFQIENQKITFPNLLLHMWDCFTSYIRLGKVCVIICETVSQVTEDFWIFCVAFCDTVSLLHQILKSGKNFLQNLLLPLWDCITGFTRFLNILCGFLWHCITVTPDFGKFVSSLLGL